MIQVDVGDDFPVHLADDLLDGNRIRQQSEGESGQSRKYDNKIPHR
jgi:hypothetical protein